ncbi:calmodulin-lysine N-methyltransferase [Corchorus olitorius]|uniref:Calmodulin-lysine N-methyltransferase n=1 Tax=Corchorus olitorius TaxID=93759 RepID=A0A1R3IC00_9ROSI|nr:calmodulin-lysine N-methyltransferase [Corchorus olitorius]
MRPYAISRAKVSHSYKDLHRPPPRNSIRIFIRRVTATKVSHGYKGLPRHVMA